MTRSTMLYQVREGDRIALDAAGRRLQLHVPEPELAARRAAWVAPPRPELASRGYYKLYYDHVLQAEQGCDFDFMLPPPETGPASQH